MRILYMLLPLLGISVAAPAMSAQERSEEECRRRHPSYESPVEYASCTADSEGARRSLNSTLAALSAQVPADHRRLLTKAQSKWAAYRDAHCSFDAGGNIGSTGNSGDVITCIADMDRERARYLQSDLKERWTR